MLLTIDIGNTNVVMGVMKDMELVVSFRMTTQIPRTSDEYGITMVEMLRNKGIDVKDIKDVIISSVVPNIMHSITNSIKKYLNKKCKCVVVDADELCKPFGSSKFFNVAILGVAVGTNATGLNADTIMYEIEHRVPERFVETNKAAFLAGIKIGEKYGIN